MRKLSCWLLATVVASGAYAGERIEERAPADPDGKVEISNVAGSVTVSGWNRAEVEITGKLGKGVERLEFEPNGDYTRIEVKLDRGENDSEETDLEIRVPEGSSLSINTVSADIEVTGVRGSQRLHGVSADIYTEIWDEDVEAQTVNGDVKLKGNDGRSLVALNTVSGDADITGVSGEIVAHTVTGDVRIDAGLLSRLRINTTNGDMDIVATMEKGARFSVEAINGDLEMRLAGDVNADFEIETINGDIDNCFGPAPEGGLIPGRELRFTEGDGDGRVTIETLNGDIELCSS